MCVVRNCNDIEIDDARPDDEDIVMALKPCVTSHDDDDERPTILLCSATVIIIGQIVVGICHCHRLHGSCKLLLNIR